MAVDLKTHNVVAPSGQMPKGSEQVAFFLAPKEVEQTTKTGHLDDSLLVGRINKDHGFVFSLVLELKRQAMRASVLSLFPNPTLKIYRERLHASAMCRGYTHVKISPHLMRHGGPSTDVIEQLIGLEDVQKRDHWHSFHSVTRYEKHAKLLHVLSKLTADPALHSPSLG